MLTVADLFQQLEDAGERRGIEAKRDLGDAAEETISAFANEPDLGGGYLVFGVEETADGTFRVVGVRDPQKLQHDFTSVCANRFSKPVRPEVEIELVDGKHVLVAFVPEASPSAKPVFIKRQGFEKGSYRRIGDGDHRCSEEDLRLLLRLADAVAYEQSVVPDARWDDLDPEAIEHYRSRLVRVEPTTEMAGASHDVIVLSVAGGQRIEGGIAPTVAGVLLFGKKASLRRLIPAQMVDYIRVGGTTWVPSGDARYEDAREIREPLLRSFERVFAETYDSLPRPFRLPPGQLERDDRPRLPERALREVLVNALMHRDYRENRPTQVIRYTDRIEIHNAGYSLTPDERFGEPGSALRNPRLSAVFRDVRLAEAKGTGIRAVRQAMAEAGMEPPVFQSDRGANLFIATLWLHNLLDDDELTWLRGMGKDGLTDAQKHGLVVARRTGKVTNAALRDLCGLDTLTASRELRALRDKGLLVMKGKAAGTFYVLGPDLLRLENAESAGVMWEASHTRGDSEGVAWEAADSASVAGPPRDSNGISHDSKTPMWEAAGSPMWEAPKRPVRKADLPFGLRQALRRIGKRSSPEAVTEVIRELCRFQPMTKAQLASLLQRNPRHVAERYLAAMVVSGDLVLRFPNQPAHPDQAYRASTPPKEDDE